LRDAGNANHCGAGEEREPLMTLMKTDDTDKEEKAKERRDKVGTTHEPIYFQATILSKVQY
jgi:hypothetical protein